ncbi:MAG: sigma-70 family RNA polymerase sigma factor [Polyangiaceae bacterium]|nr:sigma-70 family RNA polymerase sigma factor [Polyangiaceae bacterium]
MAATPLQTRSLLWSRAEISRPRPRPRLVSRSTRNVRLPKEAEPRPARAESSLSEPERDLALVALARGGDEVAFRSLIERYQGRAHAIALGLVRDEQSAQEIVQEAFLRVYRGLSRFNGSSSFFTWLYRIVSNLSIDLMRKPLRRETSFEEGMESSLERFPQLFGGSRGGDPWEILRRQEISHRVQEALDELPAYHRSAIVLRELHGLSYEEIAEATHVSKGTVMSRLFHARQKLQRSLSSFYFEQVERHAKIVKDG